ncbi:MAG: NAD+ synthase, partial [Desulfatibacillaceae bacterium]|nr:NAD+ synthase [Desulfatibacillaceae bacterium]
AFSAKARNLGADIVVFPEMCVCGYPPKDLLERGDFLRQSQALALGLVERIKGIGVILGFAQPNPAKSGRLALNSALAFEDGKIIHEATKRLLPNYDVFDETRYFEASTTAEPFLWKGAAIGLTICEDCWNDSDFICNSLYGWDPVETLAQKGAKLLVNISASPFHAGKPLLRCDLFGNLAKKHSLYCVHVNQVGGNDSLLFDGVSSVFLPDGSRAVRAAEFEEDLVVCDLICNPDEGQGTIRPASSSDAEAVYKALKMGVADYMGKCGFKTAVIGSSGGIDSALTAAIAADAIGPENVLTIFMPSPYTSAQNFIDTKSLAANLGAGYETIPIEGFFSAFLDGLAPHTSRGIPGITEQNLQARIRGIILMAFSNRYGHIVLSTGNKSELAVGYSTLYGDMCGGLAVISDVPKALVYDIARWINREREIIPQSIIEKPPSAELKPDQRDDDDLPPYEVLDPILEAYIEKGMDPAQIVKLGFDEAVVKDVTRRVMLNEYKRRQAAPGLKITPKAFGEGRRYPIAHKYQG